MIGTIGARRWRGLAKLLAIVIVPCVVNACGGGGGTPPPQIGEAEAEPSPGEHEPPSLPLPESAYVPWAEDEVHATLLPPSREESGVPHHLWSDHEPPPGIRYEPYLDSSISRDLAPVMAFGPVLHVGADVAPPAEALHGTGSRGGAALSEGALRDGIDEAEILSYPRPRHPGVDRHPVRGRLELGRRETLLPAPGRGQPVSQAPPVRRALRNTRRPSVPPDGAGLRGRDRRLLRRRARGDGRRHRTSRHVRRLRRQARNPAGAVTTTEMTCLRGG